MLKSGENAAFERCIEVMTRLIEKYGYDEDTYSNDETAEKVAS